MAQIVEVAAALNYTMVRTQDNRVFLDAEFVIQQLYGFFINCEVVKFDKIIDSLELFFCHANVPSSFRLIVEPGTDNQTPSQSLFSLFTNR